jgi:creatinine amidohydrolase
MPYGTETNLARFPLAMNVNPSTLGLVIEDLVRSLVRSNIRKVVLLNSHGGNDFKPLLRELYGKVDAQIFLCNWYQVFADHYGQIFDQMDDHAGEMETSFALAYFPHLVGRTADGQLVADAGQKSVSRLRAVREGWVSITRPWHLLTTNSGAGNPHQASPEKARRMMEIVVERLGEFLVELSQSPLDEKFPF